MALRAKTLGREALSKRLDALAPDALSEVAKANEHSAKELANAIRAEAPRGETGQYADSIEAGKVAGRNDGRKPIGMRATKDPNAWGIFADFLWRFLEFGTKAHTIKAKNAETLKIKSGDGFRFPAAVIHPGSNRKPHIFPTYRAMKKRIRARAARALRKAVKKAQG